jgi:hypothetical protein
MKLTNESGGLFRALKKYFDSRTISPGHPIRCPGSSGFNPGMVVGEESGDGLDRNLSGLELIRTVQLRRFCVTALVRIPAARARLGDDVRQHEADACDRLALRFGTVGGV